MGVNQSIPPHCIEPPLFRIGPPGKPMPRGNQYCSVRSLFWRLAPTGVTVRLETDVALCFGDVYRVLLLLHHDDAELDNNEDGGRPEQRHLLPARHQRPQFVDGVPVDYGHRHDDADADDDDDDDDDEPQTFRGHHPTQVICAAGNWMPFTRQIAHNSNLQTGSTVHMIMSGPRRTAWRALPRQHTVGGQRVSWALPGGWDDGLCDVVANHDALQLTGRSEFIRQNLIKIVEHDGMRLVSHQYDREDGKDAKRMVEQLMARVTDNIDDAPLDFFVAIRPPVDAAIYHNRSSGGRGLAPSIEFVVHVQLPPTYPLAGERYRMLTPILHPFVAPLWPDNVDVDGGCDDDKCRAWLEGGRMAFASGIKEQARPNPFSTNAEGFAEMLAWFRDEALLDPVGCASRFLEKSPDDATTEMKRWTSPGGGEKMARRASRLVQDGGVVRWRPELHPACPRAFRAEVRTLLLVRQRAQATSSMPVDDDGSGSSPMAEMPEEVVRHIIDALLGLHLSAGSSFLYFSA